jgi:hypothetical protein
MKKLFLIILLMHLFVFTCFGEFEVKFWADPPVLIYNNHVGNEWAFGLEINNQIYSLYTKNNVACGKILVINVIAQEYDKYPDTGMKRIKIDVEKLELNTEYQSEVEVIVMEDRGRYRGNTAKWKIIVRIVRLK